MHRVSIVIVTYNGLEKATRPCLESIFRDTDHPDLEVIVVDNNSTDGTPGFLASLATHESRLRAILNKDNRGFAGGNNDALRIAKGDIIVLLNNDTLVTPGWLSRIVDVLSENSTAGMVGPVTNSAGNEQNIPVSSLAPEDVISEGIIWNQMGSGDSFQTDKLCFFCVAFRRDLLQEVGMLDEQFGLGFYEDDDYCIRVKNAGYSLRCLEDVFVYHQGSASFTAIPRRTKELLKRNKRLLEAKHGISYVQRHPRDRQLDLIESYLERLETSGFDEGVWYRLDRRLDLATQLMPRGLVKRFFYFRRLLKARNRARTFESHEEWS